MKSVSLAALMAHAAASGIDLDHVIQRRLPKRDWKHDEERLAAAIDKRQRKAKRNAPKPSAEPQP